MNFGEYSIENLKKVITFNDRIHLKIDLIDVVIFIIIHRNITDSVAVL